MALWIRKSIYHENSQYDDKIKNGEVLVCNYNWTQPDKNICGEDAAMYKDSWYFPKAHADLSICKLLDIARMHLQSVRTVNIRNVMELIEFT